MKILFQLLFLLITVIPSFAQQPYTILISLDGFRWDYPNRGLTPTLEWIAQNGVRAISLQPTFPSKTFPNHIAALTGMYPENHGIIFNHFTNPFTGERYSLSKKETVTDGKWYLGEFFWETAERQGIKTASYFWPGSEISLPYRHPSYFEAYEHTRPYIERIDGVINWLQLPEEQRPRFITLYFHETDDAGHQFGPNAPETNQAIQLVDSLIGVLIDRLKAIDMLEQTNIIVISDHGMTEVDTQRIIDVEAMIADYDCKLMEVGPVMMVEPKNERDISAVYQALKSQATHFRVFLREAVPAHYHFSKNPFIGKIVLIADMGWSLHNTGSAARYRKRHDFGGNHGYDNHHMDMHGIFFAAGPSFKKGYPAGTLRNIDIYPLLCRIYNIFPRQNIDGDITKIGFILKGE